MKLNKLTKGWVTGILLATVLAGCGSTTNSSATNTPAAAPKPVATTAATPTPAASTELQKVRYAAFNGVSGLAVSFGIEKGIFKAEGLDVELVSTQDVVAGLNSKSIDVGDIATTSAIVAAGKGAPIKIVSSLFRTKGPFYLIAGPNINKIEDLKGKKIGAAAFGSGLDVTTQVILNKSGLKKTDVTLIANGVNDAAYASLTNGQVDATIIHEPFASLAELSGKGKILAKGWDYLPNFHTGVLAASNDFVEKKPEVLTKLISAYFKSQDYAKSHLDEYKKFFLATVKVDPAAVDKAFERELVLWENNPNVDLNALKETQQIQLDLGFQDKIYDIDKLVDLRFLPKK
ncbi:ABC transporter substrate-binding protein [Paenibacillus agricola]|uniref:ABC transporter substrate-binding protein n=1 Tax=Paenibacillus agricola TaxID=2716264 RepID=A0ABX0J2S9_9BACL|nr:ABC transporter substrate-binding protein [Paenibacillus agricola]NHN29731.1 ABC transporter substrate-binding protein [Paenibacillus agricola]